MKKISLHDLMIFFQGLQHLLAAGLNLISALELQIPRHPRHAQALKQVLSRLRQGQSLAVALKPYFSLPALIIQHLQQSEIHGDLPHACDLIVSYLAEQQAWKRMIWHLSFYPTILMLTSMGLLWVMLVYVLPEFASLYATLNIPLPASTAWLLRLADDAPSWARMAAILLMLGITTCLIAWSKPTGRYLLESCLLRCPGIQTIYRFHHEYHLALQLGTLLQSGCALLEAIAVMLNSTSSPIFKAYLSFSHHQIELGQCLSNSLSHGLLSNHSFRILLTHAQQTGQLDAMLLHLAKQHKQTSLYWQEQAKHLIQPCITLVLGGFLGLWILLLYYPMLQLGTNLG